MNEIKLIVTDLDGTLLRADKTVSEYTASVFERCRDIGIKIVFATARPVRAVTKWLNLPVVFDAAIYHNGAIAYIGDSKILHYGIAPQATSTIIFQHWKLIVPQNSVWKSMTDYMGIMTRLMSGRVLR